MRIQCIPTSAGPTYRVYRSSGELRSEMADLVSFLWRAGCRLLVGGTESDPLRVLAFGPLSDFDDVELAYRWRSHLDPPAS